MSEEHTFISPGPAGLGALAVACFGFGAVFTGKVGLGGLPLLAAWLVGGGIVQYTVGVMELKDHNMTGGNAFLFFSAFFMFAAALSVLAKYLMLSGIMGSVKPEPMVEGYCWLAGASFLTAITPAYLKAPKPLAMIVLLIDVALWLIVGLDMGLLGSGLKPFVGYLLFVAGFLGIYMVAVVVNNHTYGRVIFPTFGTFIK